MQMAALLDKIVDYIEAEGICCRYCTHPSTILFIIVIVERVVLKVPLGRFCQLMPDDEVSPCNFAYDLLFDNIGERLIEEMVDSFDNFFNKVEGPCASCRWREIYGECRTKHSTCFKMLGRAIQRTCFTRVKWSNCQKGWSSLPYS